MVKKELAGNKSACRVAGPPAKRAAKNNRETSEQSDRQREQEGERGRERGRGVQTAQQLALFCRTSFYFFACFLASSVVKKQPTKRTANVDKDKQQTTQKERGRGEREEEGLSNMLI